MRTFDDYSTRYDILNMTRDANGVLEVTLHTNGDSLRWGRTPHRVLTEAYRDIALDAENRVVIFAGVGEEFLGPRADEPGGTIEAFEEETGQEKSALMWEREGVSDGQELMNALLDIRVPVVCAVNGPVRRHNETALLADVIIASETASFEDTAHFHLQDLVPGDGIAVLATMLMGINRARAFMLLGRVIDAPEALALGMVSEVLPKGQELTRARAIAQQLAKKSDSTLRLTRMLLIQPVKKQMVDMSALGYAFEGLAALGRSKRP